MSKQDIPDITPEERVVRIIFHPFHIQNNGKLKRGAFLPPHNSNEVSVQRLLLFSSNSCKREGQRMASEHNKKQSKRKEYGCKYYHDPDPNSTEWEGGELI